MSKKKNYSNTKNKIENPTIEVKDKPTNLKVEFNPYIIFAILTVCIFLAYIKIWNNGFIWDDEPYITLNKNVENFNLKELLTGFAVGNYHPLTMLSLAIEYALVGEKPWLYHLDNLILHSFNSYLVFKIFKDFKLGFWVSFTTALLFAIHPLHVESVAWAAERKDVLYTFFLLLSFSFYQSYSDNSSQTKYIISIILFLLSCLSKGMAVVLPALLVITDLWIYKKPLNLKLFLNKIPYFIITLVFAYIATTAQKDAGADASAVIKAAYSVSERFQIVCYSFLFYWYKTILPINLLPFYPYPGKDASGDIPGIFSLSVIGLIAFLAITLWFGRKNKLIWWAVAFFVISISTVLQILPVGSAIVADRYYYLSSIGPLFLISLGINHLIKSQKIAQIVLVIISLICLAITISQVGHWKNGLSLFKPSEKFYPEDAMILSNLGWHYLKEKDYVTSKQYLMRADNNGFKNADVCRTIGSMFLDEGDIDKAIIYIKRAYEFKPISNRTEWLMSLAYQKKGQYAEAAPYAEKAYLAEPENPEFISSYALIMTEVGKQDAARKGFQKLLTINPENWDAYLNEAYTYRKENLLEKEIALLKVLIDKNPTYIPAYRNIGVSFSDLKQNDNAVAYWEKASQYDTTGDFEYNIGVNYANRGMIEKSKNWYKKSAKKGKPEAITILKSNGISY